MKINVSMCESEKNFQQSITNNQFCYNIKSLEFQQSQKGGGGGGGRGYPWGNWFKSIRNIEIT